MDTDASSDVSNLRAAPPLFVTDRQLRDLVAPHIGYDRFRLIMRTLEHKGFPRVNTLFHAHYYRAVRAWLDQHYGNVAYGFAMPEDGEENWDPPPRRGRPKVVKDQR